MPIFARNTEVFFGQKRDFLSRPVGDTAAVKDLADNARYSDLVANRWIIEQELEHLLSVLKIRGQDQQKYWLYAYYCSCLLNKYYKEYGKADKADYYQQLGSKITAAFADSSFPQDKPAPLSTRVANDFLEFVSTPAHMAKLRDWLGFINLNRILFGFSRITVKELILLAQQSNWFELVEQWTGMHTDVNSMVQALNNPIKVFNFLSVGVFAARFVTQATMLAKHTFAPTGDEKIILSTGERFKQELYKRHCMMLNDLVWGSINLITNYNSILKLSASTANNLTVLFLFFDLSLLIYQAYLSSEEYQALKAQYNPDDPEHGPMYKRQLAALEIKKETTYRECYFNMVGALMFIGGFSASFLLATPPAIVTGYFVCTLGVAMYLTSSAFSDYQKQALVLKNYQALAGDGADIADADIQKAMTAMQDARQVFMVTMAKNIVMPMLIMGVFAISWEVALIITAGYMAFECTKGYLGKPESVPEDGRELIHNMGIDSLSDNESDGGQPGALFLQPLPSSPELFAGK